MKWINYKREKPELYRKIMVAYKLESGNYYHVIAARQNNGLSDMLNHPISGSKIFWQPLPKLPKD